MAFESFSVDFEILHDDDNNNNNNNNDNDNNDNDNIETKMTKNI